MSHRPAMHDAPAAATAGPCRAGPLPLLLGLLMLVAGAHAARAQIGSARYSSMVMAAGTGAVLSTVNPDAPRAPASLAKLMTLYMTFEALRDRRIALGELVPVSAHAASMEPSKLGLLPGTRLTVEQAIDALVTKSANDAAAALGELLGGGSEARFGQMMTLRARALGMPNSVFRNASGLPDPEQVTTARDLAVLARHLLTDFPQEYHYFSIPSFVFQGRTIPNHDHMLQNYPGADGMKTGYTILSGFNLVTSAVRGNVRLIGVVMGAAHPGERDQHMAALLDAGFGQMGVPVQPDRDAPAVGLVASARAATLPAHPHPTVRRPVVVRTAYRHPPAPHHAAPLHPVLARPPAPAAASPAPQGADRRASRRQPRPWRALCAPGGARGARRIAARSTRHPCADAGSCASSPQYGPPFSSVFAATTRVDVALLQGGRWETLMDGGTDARRIMLYRPEDFAGMRRAGRLAAETLDMVAQHVRPGVTTGTLDRLCHDFITAHGATPAPLGYRGYPKSICTSINHVVCHGIPGERRLEPGDVLNIDVTVVLDGWHGDSSRMYVAGSPSTRARNLMDVTYEALLRGVAAVRPGATLGDVGHAIQAFVESHRFSVVRDFCGHGIGRRFHEAPNVLHFGKRGDGPVLRPGMFFTIEPMVNAGRPEVKVLDDGWTAVTRDRSLSAQFEHMVGVTHDGVEVFTRSPAGLDKPPYALAA